MDEGECASEDLHWLEESGDINWLEELEEIDAQNPFIEFMPSPPV